MKYLPIARVSADPLSQLLFGLMKSQTVAKPNDVTTAFCAVTDHPTREDVSLLHLPEETVNIAPDADGRMVQQLLEPYVQLGNITEQEQAKIGDDVIAARGKAVSIIDFLPNSWKVYLMDKATAESTGWLAATEETP